MTIELFHGDRHDEVNMLTHLKTRTVTMFRVRQVMRVLSEAKPYSDPATKQRADTEKLVAKSTFSEPEGSLPHS
jgi:hypothetical protein